jgi:hypothetical protein
MAPGLGRNARNAFVLVGALSMIVAGCGGAEKAPEKDDIFYLHGGGVIDKDKSYETYFPKLDREKSVDLPRLVGVGLFEGDVRFARPIDWTVRDANYTAEKRFISYQSPRQFIFSILERLDPPTDTWSQIETRYEKQTKELAGKFLAQRQPIGTANGQGRAYLLKSKVRGKPENFDSYATEILLRNDKRVLLVQIVHSGEIDAIAEEVNRAVSSIVLY